MTPTQSTDTELGVRRCLNLEGSCLLQSPASSPAHLGRELRNDENIVEKQPLHSQVCLGARPVASGILLGLGTPPSVGLDLGWEIGFQF